MLQAKLTRQVCKFSVITLLLGQLSLSCSDRSVRNSPPEIEAGISEDQANLFVTTASTKAVELGFVLEGLNYSIRRVKEETLQVPYHNQIVLGMLREAVNEDKRIFEVAFYPKQPKGGGVIYGGGLSVYLNPAGKIVALERQV
jgi:hypothetical protein